MILKNRWKLEGRKTISIPNENFHLRNIDKVIFLVISISIGTKILLNNK